MKSVLDVYDVELKVIGPVFIGNGKEIGKKEYVYSAWDSSVSIMDISKLCYLLNRKGMMNEYEKFMLSNSKDDIGTWFRKHGVSKSEYMECVKYTMDCGDAVLDTHSKLAIMECVKDAYGMPYVPGSSIKGMFRTILLANNILKENTKYNVVKGKIQSGSAGKIKRNTYLKKEAAIVEGKFFRTLLRPGTDETDAVNDLFSGFIVSDSEPLSSKDLILCQRTELHADGKEKKLNVLREAIRPGTRISFKITIDKSICNLLKEEIEQAVANFSRMYYECFMHGYAIVEQPKDNFVWLGGGTGFVTKTEIYPLFGKKDGIDTTVEIFRATEVPENHKHYRDRKWGVSPHICKVTYYGKKRYQMGICELTIRS